ncbi:MAG TPA: insulinase family protein [Cytophagaceae bacterium]|nr:insulinase family protein [Cytophagaceae bacterium]
MNKFLALPFLLCLLVISSFAQTEKYAAKTVQKDGFTYQEYANDPLKARVYTLSNGLTVYLSSYKDAPRIQTYIAVRAGSKNDPVHATGLAHYLEHILFKGTSRIGTQDWEKEKIYLDNIEALYEKYRKTTDAKQREALYHQIDSLSIIASTYSVANEYDKLMSTIGADGTNAYTFLEQTVYVNDIPSNQIDKWAEIEAERFGEVVPRLFHTELEAVYEEKNKGLDQDRRKVWELMMASLFQNNTYGTQTTIGTIEHLKNPSITEIKKYFKTYYVPNNMAICMSGDLDYDKTIQIIAKNFSKLKPGEIPPYTPGLEKPITAPVVKNVYGPDAENISVAFRFNIKEIVNGKTVNSRDPYFIKMIAMLLTNGQAGLIDLNLNQQQKLIGGYAYDMTFNDYSVFAMGAKPRQGQSLEEVTQLLVGQLDSIKKGKFDDWLPAAVINDYKTSKMKEYESNRSRADAFVEAFISGKKWSEYLMETDIMQKFTKQEIMKFASDRFSDNYVVIYKRKGVDSTIQKVPKPKISAVELNRDKQSAFYTQLTSKTSEEIKPVFLDYSKDLSITYFKNNPDVLYKQNTENGLFSLSFVWETKGYLDPKYGFAARYLDYLGTSKLSAEDLKKEFFKLGCSYSVSAGGDMINVSLSGLHENFDAALKLLESLLNDPKGDEEALKNLVADILKQRSDNKLNKDVILRSALANYVKYGDDNPFKYFIPEEKLKTISSSELTDLIKSLKKYKHKALYYGPAKKETLIASLETIHRKSGEFSFLSEGKIFVPKEIPQTQIYFVNYDMVQAEIIFLSKSVQFDKSLLPVVSMFNEYFGGSMGSLVFQEMRESRALAYSVRSKYEIASKKEDPNYISSYIGTQADKIIEAIDGLSELLDKMPKSEVLFNTSKQSLVESISTTRITKAAVLLNYEASQKLGLNYDIRKDIYEQVKNFNFDNIKTFQEQYIKEKPKAILVVGSKDKIDLKKLEKYGKVNEMKPEAIFGY